MHARPCKALQHLSSHTPLLRPLSLVVPQEARRAVGAGVKVQFVSVNKESHILEVPEVSFFMVVYWKSAVFECVNANKEGHALEVPRRGIDVPCVFGLGWSSRSARGECCASAVCYEKHPSSSLSPLRRFPSCLA